MGCGFPGLKPRAESWRPFGAGDHGRRAHPRATRRAAGYRLEAYATLRRGVFTVGARKRRQDDLAKSLDTPESSVG
jgi:hypothetical protein